MTDDFRVPAQGAPIDREGLVRRHGVRLTQLDPQAPLQVGNGRFAMAVDVTGLQTFPDAYPAMDAGTLLGTMAEWAWHSMPAPWPYSLDETLRTYSTARGPVPYVDLSTETHDGDGQTDAETWLRGDPHKLDLGRIGLDVPGDAGLPRAVEQHLDLWSGIIESRCTVGDRSYHVTTAAHPERDVVAWIIRTTAGQDIRVRMRFPYASTAWGDAADWTRPDAHHTTLARTADRWRVRRDLDATTYWVTVHAPGADMEQVADHELVISGDGPLSLVVGFFAAAPDAPDAPLPGAAEVVAASRDAWAAFWATGAAIDLAGSSDARAPELERRIVHSQYLTRVQCAGSMPPAETGLLCASWRSKHHLEMHWAHGAHHAVWGRPELLEPSLAWYRTILPAARATAVRQGLRGARWPKQVGPDGRETPSSIGPFLVWQQPHPIHLAELLYRASPTRDTLERWADLVHETAECMATFPTPGPDGRLHLGPPIVPAQESYHGTRATAQDPTFELAAWVWALDIAARWWERRGLAAPAHWRSVARSLAAPLVRDGRYMALATWPYLERDDHPSMLGALGIIPATSHIDPVVMGATLDDVTSDWRWETAWGWDHPMVAMTATRLGRGADAIAALMRDVPTNTWLANGHVRQGPRLPAYLPANGALLAAIALLVGGWDGSPPPDWGPGWSVAHEGFVRLP